MMRNMQEPRCRHSRWSTDSLIYRCAKFHKVITQTKLEINKGQSNRDEALAL